MEIHRRAIQRVLEVAHRYRSSPAGEAPQPEPGREVPARRDVQRAEEARRGHDEASEEDAPP